MPSRSAGERLAGFQVRRTALQMGQGTAQQSRTGSHGPQGRRLELRGAACGAERPLRHRNLGVKHPGALETRLQDGTVKDWSMKVNDRICIIKTDAAGRYYIEVAENAEKKYDAVIYNANSPMWYGTSALTDVVVPYSQFWNNTVQDFANYPRYASYSPETGNILVFSDAVALLNVKLSGSASATSVKATGAPSTRTASTTPACTTNSPTVVRPVSSASSQSSAQSLTA